RTDDRRRTREELCSAPPATDATARHPTASEAPGSSFTWSAPGARGCRLRSWRRALRLGRARCSAELRPGLRGVPAAPRGAAAARRAPRPASRECRLGRGRAGCARELRLAPHGGALRRTGVAACAPELRERVQGAAACEQAPRVGTRRWGVAARRC